MPTSYRHGRAGAGRSAWFRVRLGRSDHVDPLGSLLGWPGWAYTPISNFKVSLPRGFAVSSCPLWEVGVGRMKTPGRRKISLSPRE